MRCVVLEILRGVEIPPAGSRLAQTPAGARDNLNDICDGFLKILKILDYMVHFPKINRILEILGAKNPKFRKTEITIL